MCGVVPNYFARINLTWIAKILVSQVAALPNPAGTVVSELKSRDHSLYF